MWLKYLTISSSDPEKLALVSKVEMVDLRNRPQLLSNQLHLVRKLLQL